MHIYSKALLLIILICNSLVALAESSLTMRKKTNRDYFKSQPVKFLENKGQMKDMIGNPIPFALYKCSTPGLDLYITKKGLTYVFFQFKEKENKMEKKGPRPVSMRKTAHDESSTKWERIDLRLDGANIRKENIIEEGQSEDHFNYFYGHCLDGIYDVYEYNKITIKDVYPGIDWVIYNSTENGFKYDFVVHSGADPKMISLGYNSLKPLRIDNDGNLNIKSKTGSLTESAPFVYLEGSGNSVDCCFRKISQSWVGDHYETKIVFAKNKNGDPLTYDQSKTLVIDPQLVWATFYPGSSTDGPRSIDTDNSGNLFVTGYAYSLDFPTQNTGSFYQGTHGGGFEDIFLLKFNAAGTRIWATYYGGTASDRAQSIRVDPSGNLFVTGYSSSPNFPLQNSNTFFQGTMSGGGDMIILKFNNAGVRLWATYLGGSATSLYDQGCSMDIDANGNIFIAGISPSSDFPLLNNGGFFQGTFGGGQFDYDVVILKFDNSGNLLWSTYYGGTDNDIASAITCDPSGNIFITGYTSSTDFPVLSAGTFFQGANAGSDDLFLLKFSNTGARLWATYYGGSNTEPGGVVRCDANGNLIVVAFVFSSDFPVLAGSVYFQGSLAGNCDMAILKFNNQGTRLWATYYGASGDENGGFYYDALAVASCGDFYFTFLYDQANFPTVNPCDGGYYDNSYNGGAGDIVITHMTDAGAPVWTTYYGGGGYDFVAPVTLDNSENLYMSGEWTNASSTSSLNSSTYPVTNPGGSAFFDGTFNGEDDPHITKFVMGMAPAAAGFSYTGPACSNGGTLAPTTASNFISGGTFTSSAGLNLNQLTGLVTASASTSGTYVVSYLNLPCGCASVAVASTTVVIAVPVSVSINGVSLCDGNSAVLEATVNPAVSATYSWSPISAATNSVLISPSASSIYSVKVTDSNGCVITQTVAAEVTPCASVNEYMVKGNIISVFPNPNKGEFTVSSRTAVILKLLDQLGRHIKNVVLTETNGFRMTISGLPAGTYFLSGENDPQGYKIIVQ